MLKFEDALIFHQEIDLFYKKLKKLTYTNTDNVVLLTSLRPLFTLISKIII